MKLIIFSTAILFLATGCSTFSKEDCQAMNWERQGYATAYNGERKSQGLEYYMRECGQEHGIQPDPAAFTQGYKAGLENYCTKERGQEVGLAGGNYQNICPEGKDREFLKTFVPSKMQSMSSELSELKRDNSRLKSQNSDLEDEVKKLKSELDNVKNK